MTLYEFLSNGNTIEVDWGKNYSHFAYSKRWMAKDTNLISNLLILDLREHHTSIFYIANHPEEFTMKNAKVRLYDQNRKCLLRNKSIKQAQHYIQNY